MKYLVIVIVIIVFLLSINKSSYQNIAASISETKTKIDNIDQYER